MKGFDGLTFDKIYGLCKGDNRIVDPRRSTMMEFLDLVGE